MTVDKNCIMLNSKVMRTKNLKISKLGKIALTTVFVGSSLYYYADSVNVNPVYTKNLASEVVPYETEIQQILSNYSINQIDTPAVVRIIVDSPSDSNLQNSTGSAFFVSQDGYLVTNNHVVKDNSKYLIKVDEKQNTTYEAKVVYRDSLYDLAVLKIEGTGFPYLNLISYDDWKKFDSTQQVTAVGHPYGLEDDFVYTGSIVGLNEAIYLQNDGGGAAFEKFTKLVSTSMELSPGDSGGPLLDAAGRVIGVNVAISVSGSKKSFMIPAIAVRRILSKLNVVGY